jgi:RNA polymerase sigma-70 factor (ECF subfamily)
LTPADQCKINPAVVAALYVRHAEELRSFLIGVLRDHHLANDVLQITFAKAVEEGHTAHEESLKGWLFQVAYHEALAVRRRQAVHDRAARKLAQGDFRQVEAPEASLVRWETVQQVRAALEELPAEQRQVVRLRMYEQQKFSAIAEQLGVPLGTVLTRMQLALRKLRKRLEIEK